MSGESFEERRKGRPGVTGPPLRGRAESPEERASADQPQQMAAASLEVMLSTPSTGLSVTKATPVL